jgi:excisionase family DNA binding protein
LSDLSDALSVLPHVARKVDPEDLPRLRSLLAEADSIALYRLVTHETTRAVRNDADQNLSIDEAAKRLGMSKSWVYKRRKSLPFAYKLGSRIVFSAHGLERWIEHRQGA